jgi:hypothetical protein
MAEMILIMAAVGTESLGGTMNLAQFMQTNAYRDFAFPLGAGKPPPAVI